MTKSLNAKGDFTCLILGAGFSKCAGLPLTSEIFDTVTVPRFFSRKAEEGHIRVIHSYANWKNTTGKNNAEEWLNELYAASPGSLGGASWDDAILFMVSRLAILSKPGNKAPYYVGISSSVECEDHRRFWTRVRKEFNLKSVITTNYDILAEQGLHAVYKRERDGPLCSYGGHTIQFVRTYTNVATRPATVRETRLGTELKIFKMHGSLNWAFEPHAFKIHDSLHAAFRVSKDKGCLAIVPPLPEKERPDWLALVWRYAEAALMNSRTWIVCGYSCPAYDEAMRSLLLRSGKEVEIVLLLDPYSRQYEALWRDLAPRASVKCLPGLPEVLSIGSWA